VGTRGGAEGRSSRSNGILAGNEGADDDNFKPVSDINGGGTGRRAGGGAGSGGLGGEGGLATEVFRDGGGGGGCPPRLAPGEVDGPIPGPGGGGGGGSAADFFLDFDISSSISATASGPYASCT
jgi:hypothetical protein